MPVNLVPFIDTLIKPFYVHGVDFIQASQKNFRVCFLLLLNNNLVVVILICHHQQQSINNDNHHDYR